MRPDEFVGLHPQLNGLIRRKAFPVVPHLSLGVLSMWRCRHDPDPSFRARIWRTRTSIMIAGVVLLVHSCVSLDQSGIAIP